MFEPRGVYWVSSKEDRTVLLAILPRIKGRNVEWYDGLRDRGFQVESTSREGEAIVVVTPKATYRFLPLTVERYREKVRPRVQGDFDFVDDESLRRFYLDKVE